MKKEQRTPCNECAFRRDCTPDYLTGGKTLGGSPPEVYIGQSLGPFVVPCHRHYAKDDPDGRKGLFDYSQCAGMAVYRANNSVTGLPPAIKTLPPSSDVFATHAEFLAHHTGMSVALAEIQLGVVTPHDLLAHELQRSGVVFKKL